MFLSSGCGSVTYSTPPGSSLIIETQPLSQTVPITQTATFTVGATGTAPLTYQWSENGTPIPGATGLSYTTPAVELGPNDDTSIGSFQVTVSDASSSVMSDLVTLTAGPRSPKAGDLRYLLFQQVDIPGLGDDGSELFAWSDGYGQGGGNFSANSAVGSPLSLGAGPAWHANVDYLPPPITGLSIYYTNGTGYSSFASDMQSIVDPNVVIDSLDFEPAAGSYAVAYVETTQSGGFDYRLDPLIPSGIGQQAGIQAQAALDGTQSRVITAVSFDAAGNANLISYGWTGDTTTVYEATTTIVPSNDVCTAASTMANAGYIISAFGGNDADGYMLIGMRVQGDTLPRLTAGNSIPPYGTEVVWIENGCSVFEQ
jgi:hypothetical protein